MTKRIEYIDALRGFIMILVVMGHVVIFTYERIDGFSWSIFSYIFQLPLFFFVSGFVMYKSKTNWDLKMAKSFLVKKFRTLIISTTAILSIYAYLKGYTFDYVIGNGKAGYWFTFALFIYYFLYVSLSLLMDKIKMGEERKFVMFSIIGICLTMVVCRPMNNFIASHPILNVVSIQQWRYFVFFIFGVIAKRYFHIFKHSINNDGFMATLLLAFIISLVLFYNTETGILGIKLKFIGWGCMGICVVFAFFSEHETLFSKKTYLGKTLQYIGKRTLDIYLLHYFFLSYEWGLVGDFFTTNPNPTVEVFVTFSISLMVIALCLLTSNIIRLSPQLAHWVLGSRTKR